MPRPHIPARLPLPLLTERLQLRLPTEADASAYLRILNSPPVLDLMLPRRAWTRSEVLASIRKRLAEARRGERYDLAVLLRDGGSVIGRVGLKGVDPVHQRAELAYWFGPNYWGKGLAFEASRRVLEAGFQHLHLHRVDAGVFDFNLPSVRLLQRLGFRPEGELRAVLRHQGGWVNELRFGLLEGELPPEGPTARSVRRGPTGAATRGPTAWGGQGSTRSP